MTPITACHYDSYQAALNVPWNYSVAKINKWKKSPQPPRVNVTDYLIYSMSRVFFFIRSFNTSKRSTIVLDYFSSPDCCFNGRKWCGTTASSKVSGTHVRCTTAGGGGREGDAFTFRKDGPHLEITRGQADDGGLVQLAGRGGRQRQQLPQLDKLGILLLAPGARRILWLFLHILFSNKPKHSHEGKEKKKKSTGKTKKVFKTVKNFDNRNFQTKKKIFAPWTNYTKKSLQLTGNFLFLH